MDLSAPSLDFYLKPEWTVLIETFLVVHLVMAVSHLFAFAQFNVILINNGGLTGDFSRRTIVRHRTC